MQLLAKHSATWARFYNVYGFAHSVLTSTCIRPAKTGHQLGLLIQSPEPHLNLI
jgi:hypothetical protein